MKMTEWISVKDRLPEKNGRYLVCVPYSSCPWVGVSSYRTHNFSGEKCFDDETATHWMILPDPPKVIPE